MTDYFERDEEPDAVLRAFADASERGVTHRPETDLGEGNASRHYSEDYRRGAEPEQTTMWIDPVTGEPVVLP